MATEKSKDVEMKEATDPEAKSEQTASDDTATDPARAQKDKDLLTFEGCVVDTLVANELE